MREARNGTFLATHFATESVAERTRSGFACDKPALRTATWIFASIFSVASHVAQAGPASDGLNWSSTTQSNGALAVSVKQPISSVWDSWIGADLTVARQPAMMSELLAQKVECWHVPQSSGSAWAVATAPGTALTKSMPQLNDYSLAMEDDKWLRTFGVEPKLFNGVTIFSAIVETAQGTNMSLTAGFKKSW